MPYIKLDNHVKLKYLIPGELNFIGCSNFSHRVAGTADRPAGGLSSLNPVSLNLRRKKLLLSIPLPVPPFGLLPTEGQQTQESLARSPPRPSTSQVDYDGASYPIG